MNLDWKPFPDDPTELPEIEENQCIITLQIGGGAISGEAFDSEEIEITRDPENAPHIRSYWDKIRKGIRHQLFYVVVERPA